MKISEIKDKGLRELAELRRNQSERCYSDLLCDAFNWNYTLEKHTYWLKVYMCEITTLTKEPTATPSEVLLSVRDLRIQLLENENRELKKQIEDLEVVNSMWKNEMDLQLKYSAWERKEKRELIEILKNI
tara:strand:+ start:260 stop:649 length:390 start_codon:yes stop_codon:yes gene_type:complete